MSASLHRTIIGLGFLGLFLHSTPAAGQTLAALQQEIAAANGRVIVGLKPANAARGMTRPGVRALTNAEAGTIAQRLSGLGLRVTRNYRLITAVAGVATDAAVARLVSDPNVEYVVPDRIHTLQDERGRRSAAVRPLVEVTPYGIAKIRAPEAWASTNPANYGAGVKVGILDTGGDFDHEDLAFAGGFDAVIGSTAPADWDDNVPACGGHGTHVAGTVAAVRDNNVGVVGVAPGASVYAIQIFVQTPGGGCGAFTSDIIAGVEWAVTNGIQVVNMSYGGLGFDPAEHAAYQAAYAAGVHLVAASGNAGLPVSSFTPAAYPEVIAVAATDGFDAWASFSNFGPEVFVSAPGVSVLSALPGNTYAEYHGTSMASPHVTGLVALLLAVDATLSNASIRGLLGAGAVDLGAAGRDDQFGEGRIDALNSVGLANQQTTTATQLVLLQQPGAGVSGQPLTPAPTVELRDGLNQPVLQAGVVVTATISSGPGRATGLGRRIEKTGAQTDRLAVEPATTAVVTDATGQAVFSSLAVTTVVTAQHVLTFSAGALTPAVSAPFTVTGSAITLTNGVPVPGLSGAQLNLRYFVLSVPAGVGTLAVTTTGGSGDADLAVQFGVPPTLGSYDCASAADGNVESCVIGNPSVGDWYIMLFAYTDYAGVTLTATASGVAATQMSLLQQPQAATSGQVLVPPPAVQLLDAQGQAVALAGVPVTAAIHSGPGQVSVLTGRRDESTVTPFVTTVTTNGNGQATFPSLTVTSLATADHELVFSARNVTELVSDPFNVTGTTPTPLTSGVPVPGLSGATGSTAFYVLTVPAGQGSVTVTTTGGTGDADLYVRPGTLPTTASFACRSIGPTNTEICTLTDPAAGEWYVLLSGFSPFSGLTLTARYAAEATQLSLLQQPQNGASGAPLAPAPMIQLLDAANQAVAQPGVRITAAISSGPGEISVVTPSAGTAAGSGPKQSPAQPATLAATTNASGRATFSNLFVTTVTTADHQLVFSAPSITPLVSQVFSVTGAAPITLTNAVPVSGLSGALHSVQYYVIAIPAGQTNLLVVMSGGNGDADLYVREGALPTTSLFDCRPFFFGNDEDCQFSDPAAGNWYIMVEGFEPYDGVTLTATHVTKVALTATLSGTGGGSITGPDSLNCTLSAGQTTGTCSAQVDAPSNVFLHAQPAAGSSFAGWGGASASCGVLADCLVATSGATAVSAVFNALPNYTVTVQGTGTGSGTVTGGGVGCSVTVGVASGTCSLPRDSGSVITLTAVPHAGRTFSGWAGDCTGTGTCQLQMTQARSVTAWFSHPPADVDRMVANVLGTPTLTPAEVQRWDCNASSAFDLGDLLCYLDRNPGLTLAPAVMAELQRRSVATPPAKPAGTGRVN